MRARSLPILLLTALAASLLLGGCATTQEDPNKVSTIPWNRPQSWEGQGALGGFSTDYLR